MTTTNTSAARRPASVRHSDLAAVRQLSREVITRLALAYDADPLDVREQVAAWLAEHGSYGQGAAASLLRRRRHPVYTAQPREVA